MAYFEQIQERYQLAMERITTIVEENATDIKEPYKQYFIMVAAYLLDIKKTLELVSEGKLKEYTQEELAAMNHYLYKDLMETEEVTSYLKHERVLAEKIYEGSNKKEKELGYENSYANPAWAKETLGEKYGKVLCFVYTELRGLLPYAFEQRYFDITIALELFIEIYNLMEEENGDATYQSIKQAIYYYVSDYCDITMPRRIREMLDPSLSFFTEIIEESNLQDLSYLYYFGEYISENERKIAEFLNKLPQKEIEAMASTYTNGFRQGFITMRIDMSKKSIVNIRCNVGFERVIKVAIKQFRDMGLEPTIYRAAVSSIHKRQHLKIGFTSTSVNRQFDYDHRFGDALYLDKAFAERKLVGLRMGYEACEDFAKQYAGPAVMEIFGEKSFTPKKKEEALQLSEKQQKIFVEYQRDSSLLSNEYIKSDEYSFTIIAYPIPEIGEQFEDIFAETVKVNTLNMDVYRKIQQVLIDALDQGEYVHILGKKDGMKNPNRTDLKIMLHSLEDPEKETNFENCLADVNIPVGEVFTSPRLTGTSGLLHVGQVYLNELEYINLELEFQDGKVVKYEADNFTLEEVKENLLYQRETLPMGEFAIGTNTTAYVMGKKYKISDKLPILIAEKTGPHFAIGDTCYKMSEENRIFNPDGKEIVAKDNECSILRKTEIEKAYFNCHTDITIPYDELGEISVYTKEGNKVILIKDGKFVLEGTQALNIPLEKIEASIIS